MIDAERMLGSLVRNAMGSRGGRRGRRRSRRRSGLSTGMKGAIGLGALGVAMAAFEHFTQKGASAGTAFGGASTTPPGPPGGAPPPPPTAGTAGPPPPPPAESTNASPEAGPPPPPPPGAAATSTGDREAEAMLLVRAMIAAANADHDLDPEERRRIVGALDTTGLAEEARRFLLAELESPISIGKLVSSATSPELRRQVYVASRMAIEVDTPAEENYLRRLAERLELSPDEIAELDAIVDGEGETRGA